MGKKKSVVFPRPGSGEARNSSLHRHGFPSRPSTRARPVMTMNSRCATLQNLSGAKLRPSFNSSRLKNHCSMASCSRQITERDPKVGVYKYAVCCKSPEELTGLIDQNFTKNRDQIEPEISYPGHSGLIFKNNAIAGKRRVMDSQAPRACSAAYVGEISQLLLLRMTIESIKLNLSTEFS